ncbi:MAG: type II toxin-antitoxin system Phd/YefM family antitoxin [Roseiarcus sp.]
MLAKASLSSAFRVHEAKRVPLTVEMTDASERLDELVARAEAGEEIVICRDGAPVAKLVALDAERRPAAIEETIEEARAFRARAKPVTAEELIAWKNEGRRY